MMNDHADKLCSQALACALSTWAAAFQNRIHLIIGGTMVLLLAIAPTAESQGAGAAGADSVEAWTAKLRSGSLMERVDAAGALSAIPSSMLPAATQGAFVDELNRLNELFFSAAPDAAVVEGADELGEDSFGEYYIDLVSVVAHIDTPAAEQALVRSVAVSGGVQRRVARQGDRAVPELVRMIQRGYERGSALETLALAWYWADSTGAPLSSESRSAIVHELVAAPQSYNYAVRRSAATVLALTGDPVFLPLALELEERAEATGERLIAGALRRDAIPLLLVRESAKRPVELVRGVRCALDAVCFGISSGPTLGACMSLGNQLQNAVSHLEQSRIDAAREVLLETLANADAALSSGAFSAAQHLIVAGGVSRALTAL